MASYTRDDIQEAWAKIHSYVKNERSTIVEDALIDTSDIEEMQGHIDLLISIQSVEAALEDLPKLLTHFLDGGDKDGPGS